MFFWLFFVKLFVGEGDCVLFVDIVFSVLFLLNNIFCLVIIWLSLILFLLVNIGEFLLVFGKMIGKGFEKIIIMDNYILYFNKFFNFFSNSFLKIEVVNKDIKNL